MTTTLASLLTTQTQAQVFQTLLGYYQSAGFPTQSWQVGGVERTRLMAISTAIVDIVGNYIPTYTGGGFLDYATGAWLQLHAQELYNILYSPASNTQGNITLTSAAGVGAATYAAGALKVVFSASGNRYISNAPITIAAGPGSVVGTFTAEFAGASYNDANNSGALTLVTPIPGVTLTNPAGNYTTVGHVGSGTGTITPSSTPIGNHQVTVRIDSTGASGAVSWSYALDGAAYVSVGAVASYLIASANITITLVNGASGTSFVLNDTYTFYCPGSWITTQGSNVETDTALAARCRARWASLSNVPTSSLYELLATSTTSVGSQVTQVIVIPDGTINNKVNIIVAGPGGVLPPATVALVQAFITARSRGCDNPVVQSPTQLNVSFAGTITVSAAYLTAAQAAIQTAMTNYVAGIGINGTLRVSAITELIMQVTGAVDVSAVTINGSASNLVMGSSTSFVLPSLQPLAFTYVTV
jgi:uncharacterized phage protein gp47/JayE